MTRGRGGGGKPTGSKRASHVVAQGGREPLLRLLQRLQLAGCVLSNLWYTNKKQPRRRALGTLRDSPPRWAGCLTHGLASTVLPLVRLRNL
jgi:hypothetical protein